jgi:hypothetical protein
VEQITAVYNTRLNEDLSSASEQGMECDRWPVDGSLVLLPPAKRTGKQQIAIVVGNRAGEV